MIGMPKSSRISRLALIPPLHRRFGYRLSMLSTTLSQQMLLRVQREFGLNLAEYRILMALAQFEFPSIRDIAKNSQLDKAHVTRALADLIKRGLATQAVDRHDRRLRIVALTPAGRQITAALAPFQIARQRRLEQRLTKSELRIFWKAIAALSDEADHMLADEEQLSATARQPVNAAKPDRRRK